MEIEEQVGADSEVVLLIDGDTVRKDLVPFYEGDIRTTAIVCMHGYRYPYYEQMMADTRQYKRSIRDVQHCKKAWFLE